MSRCASPLYAAAIADAWREAGSTVVWANGCFDLLHAGHVHHLEEARRAGDFLIVGMNSDASVRALKGPGRPFVPEGQRAAMLVALRCVDLLVVFDEPSPARIVELIRPEVIVVGYGQRPGMAEAVAAARPEIRVVRLEVTPWFGVSTGAVARRVRGEP